MSEEFNYIHASDQQKPRGSIFPCFWNKNSDERSQLARRRVQVESVFASDIETITVNIWRTQKLLVGESIFEDSTRRAADSILPFSMNDVESENVEFNVISSSQTPLQEDINGSKQAPHFPQPSRNDVTLDLAQERAKKDPHDAFSPYSPNSDLDALYDDDSAKRVLETVSVDHVDIDTPEIGPTGRQADDYNKHSEELIIDGELGELRVISATSTCNSNLSPNDLPDATPKSLSSSISHSAYYRKEASGLHAESKGDIGLRKIMSIEIDRREAKHGVGSVQRIYNELYDKISPDQRLGLYTNFVLVNEHGQYVRPMSELSEYFNINRDEDGEYHLDSRLNLFLQQRVHTFFGVEKIRKCTCFGVIKFVLLLVLVFGFALTIVFLILVAVVIEFSIFFQHNLDKRRRRRKRRR